MEMVQKWISYPKWKLVRIFFIYFFWIVNQQISGGNGNFNKGNYSKNQSGTDKSERSKSAFATFQDYIQNNGDNIKCLLPLEIDQVYGNFNLTTLIDMENPASEAIMALQVDYIRKPSS